VHRLPRPADDGPAGHPPGVPARDAGARPRRRPDPHLPSVGRWRRGDRTSPYDANADATNPELRSFVCGQCHSEYYLQKDSRLVTYPWDRGLAAEQIADHYAEIGFADWTYKAAGTPILKAQHPEFETWGRGPHAALGLSCADCYMPATGTGKEAVTRHHVRSPLAGGVQTCLNCHREPEPLWRGRVADVQGRTRKLLDRAEDGCVELIRAIEAAKARGATDAALTEARALHRAAQWRTDFVLSENGRGFHAPQEAARVLGEAIEMAARGRMRAVAAR
jgi:nitrite reductase (cytochrome c-552)